MSSKLVRQKKNRKTLNWYCSTFAIDDPYHVILDGNFVNLALTHRMDLKEAIPALLGATAKCYITQCMYHELRELGKIAVGASIAARRFLRLKCAHSPPLNPVDCAMSILGRGKPFFICTTDNNLRMQAHRLCSGIATISFHPTSKTLMVDPPTERELKAAKRMMEARQSGLMAHEIRALKPTAEEDEKQKELAKLKAKRPKKVKGPKRLPKRPRISVVSTHKRHRSRKQKRLGLLRKLQQQEQGSGGEENGSQDQMSNSTNGDENTGNENVGNENENNGNENEDNGNQNENNGSENTVAFENSAMVE